MARIKTSVQKIPYFFSTHELLRAVFVSHVKWLTEKLPPNKINETFSCKYKYKKKRMITPLKTVSQAENKKCNQETNRKQS